MILTGTQALDMLSEAQRLIKVVKEANIVDCDESAILLIKVNASFISQDAQSLENMYETAFNKMKDAERSTTHEITPDGTQLRYTAVLRPTENINANWLKMSFNDRPYMNEEIYYLGQTYKVTSVRKNF